jgi:Fic family protein
MNLAIETPSRIEPCLLEQTGPVIVDLVASLSAASSRLGTRLHPRSAASLADAVRIMNCYYSNLIEGHNTTLREIERAMAGQLDTTEERRNLQVEARAHIRVQRDIDRRFALDDLFEPASVDFIRGLHKAFYEDAPEAMLTVGDENRAIRMVPGAFRDFADQEVAVGRHLPPSGDRVEAFMSIGTQKGPPIGVQKGPLWYGSLGLSR